MNFLKNATRNVALDQATSGAIQSARWEAQDSTLPDPYSPGAAQGVKSSVLALGRRYLPADQKKVAKKAPYLNQR